MISHTINICKWFAVYTKDYCIKGTAMDAQTFIHSYYIEYSSTQHDLFYSILFVIVLLLYLAKSLHVSPLWWFLLSSTIECRSIMEYKPWRKEPSSTLFHSPNLGMYIHCCISKAYTSPGKRWRFPKRQWTLFIHAENNNCNKEGNFTAEHQKLWRQRKVGQLLDSILWLSSADEGFI